MYHPTTINNDVPVVGTLLLTPIKEMDSGSVNNTLQVGHPTTAALAKAVLPSSIQANFGNSSVSIPITTTGSIVTTNSSHPVVSVIMTPTGDQSRITELLSDIPDSYEKKDILRKTNNENDFGERKSSVRSAKTLESSKTKKGPKLSYLETSSAPSTLTKAKTEAKSGEVYV